MVRLCFNTDKYAPTQRSIFRKRQHSQRFFVGSTFLMSGNFDSVNNPEFIQLNVGYRITPKDVVFIEFKSSKFA